MQDSEVTQINTSSNPPAVAVEEEKKETLKIEMKYFKIGAGYVNA